MVSRNRLTTYVDVTVRHPQAERYLYRAARHDNAANDKAAADKRHRYPPSQGVKVTPFPCEIYGQMAEMQKLFLSSFPEPPWTETDFAV